jgi:hypothetical protein
LVALAALPSTADKISFGWIGFCKLVKPWQITSDEASNVQDVREAEQGSGKG